MCWSTTFSMIARNYAVSRALLSTWGRSLGDQTGKTNPKIAIHIPETAASIRVFAAMWSVSQIISRSREHSGPYITVYLPRRSGGMACPKYSSSPNSCITSALNVFDHMARRSKDPDSVMLEPSGSRCLWTLFLSTLSFLAADDLSRTKPLFRHLLHNDARI